MARRNGGMAQVAELAVIPRGNVGRDQFALTRRERVGLVQQDVSQLAHRLRSLRADREPRDDSGNSFRQLDVGHDVLLFRILGCPWSRF